MTKKVQLNISAKALYKRMIEDEFNDKNPIIIRDFVHRATIGIPCRANMPHYETWYMVADDNGMRRGFYLQESTFKALTGLYLIKGIGQPYKPFKNSVHYKVNPKVRGQRFVPDGLGKLHALYEYDTEMEREVASRINHEELNAKFQW